jgi:CDP-diacylglycerol--serine O-phosphatidyltransferase
MSFKIKDIFTLINLLISLFAIILAIEGQIELASKVILVCWLFDGLDGLVARLTKSANKFGSEFDNLVDLFSFSLAPGFVIFASYITRSKILAIILFFYIISIGTIRLARYNTKPLQIPGYWIGLPRPATGLFIIFLLNSRLFLNSQLYFVVTLLIVVAGYLSLTYLPYLNNKAKLTHFQTFIVFLAPISSLLLYPFGYTWEAGTMWMIVYILTPWTSVKKRERAEIRSFVEEWKKV